MRWPLLLLLCPTLSLAETRVEAAAGLDSNVSHAEGPHPTQSPLLRLTLEAHEVARLAPLTLDAHYQGGARRFEGAEGEDGFSQRLEGQARWSARPDALLQAASLSVALQERVSRAPAFPRDFTRVSGEATAQLGLGPTRLGLSLEALRFDYEPLPDQSFEGLGGALSLSWRGGAASSGLGGRLAARRFEGDALVVVSEGVLERGEARRADALWGAYAWWAYQGAVVARLELSYGRNQSNSAQGGYVHQQAQAQLTAPIYGVLASAQLNLQRLDYASRQYISEDDYLDDEARTSLRLRLERPVGEAWSLLGDLGAWFSPFNDGPEYTRRLLLFGIAYHQGP
ncbi:hypothetical protein KKF91_02990 [Myxococcota bacterium]|nr:hypothetical protein [Myxococcota bacterium]